MFKNLANHRQTVVFDRKQILYNTFKPLLWARAVFLFIKKQCLIDTRNSVLSIILKMSNVPLLKLKISQKRSVLELWHVSFESQYCLTHKRIFILWRLMWVSFKTFPPTCCYVVVGPEKLTMTLFHAHRVELNLIGTYAMKTSKKRREENEMETKKSTGLCAL